MAIEFRRFPHSAIRSEYFRSSFEATFKDIKPVASAIVSRAIPSRARPLRDAVGSLIKAQDPTEYPFLFRFSFSHRERDWLSIKPIAAAVHLLQTSTFIIDDILDGAGLRNGVPTLHRSNGIPYALVIAQFLESTALDAIVSEVRSKPFPNPEAALSEFHHILPRLYIGQYLDLKSSRDLSFTYRAYLQVAFLTTASFLASVARAGALLSGKSPYEVDTLTEFARCYGMALQITDDALDITASSSRTGKSYARDLHCRRMRLPLIMALKLAPSESRSFLRNFISGGRHAPGHVRLAATIIRKSGAIDTSIAIAGRYIAKAIRALSRLGNSKANSMLCLLALDLIPEQGLFK
jgi:octaprenyl-diphosphate synthase